VSAPTVPQITRLELVERLRDPTLTIVNVLAHEAWKQQRIPGSLSLPVGDIPSRAASVLPDRDADVAVYCASPT
jgi:rhodanese-related sulfurtransferase